MSHFFTHLISRNFDVGEKGEVVRPRVPAFFETDRAGYQALDLSTVEEETVKVEVSPIKQSRNMDPVYEPRAATPTKSRTIVSADIQDQTRRSTIQHLHQESPSVSPDLQEVQENPTRTIPTEDTRQISAEIKQPHPQPAAPTPAEITAVPVNVRIEQREESVAPRIMPRPRNPAIVSAEKKLSHHQSAPQNLLLHADDNRPMQSQTSPPTIHVTIGRVEVRAATAPAATVKAPRQSPSPSLTLNDYLKQRQEGRR